MQPISQTPYDLNNEPFNEQTILDHLNTKLVHIPTVCHIFQFQVKIERKLNHFNFKVV